MTTAQIIWQRSTPPLAAILIPRVINLVLGQLPRKVRKLRRWVSVSVLLLEERTLPLVRLQQAALLMESGSASFRSLGRRRCAIVAELLVGEKREGNGNIRLVRKSSCRMVAPLASRHAVVTSGSLLVNLYLNRVWMSLVVGRKTSALLCLVWVALTSFRLPLIVRLGTISTALSIRPASIIAFVVPVCRLRSALVVTLGIGPVLVVLSISCLLRKPRSIYENLLSRSRVHLLVASPLRAMTSFGTRKMALCSMEVVCVRRLAARLEVLIV